MALRQLALDRGLAVGEPVERVVQVVDRGVVEVGEGGEGGLAGGAKFAFDGQLGAGPKQAADDQGEGAGALGAGPVEAQALDAELAGEGEDGADCAVLAESADAHGVGLGIGRGEFVEKGAAEEVNGVPGGLERVAWGGRRRR